MRFLAELFTPGLKCERVGHIRRSEKRTGYVLPSSVDIFGQRYVVVRVRQERYVCAHCKSEVSPWTDKSRDGISSFTSDQETWDRIIAGGDWRYQ